jgi:hypothetical protein
VFRSIEMMRKSEITLSKTVCIPRGLKNQKVLYRAKSKPGKIG